MKRIWILLNFFLSVFCAQTKASDVIVDGISYDVDLSTMEATVVSGDYDFRDIIIPKSFTYNGREFSVVTIGEYAFSRMGANNLISLSLPNSIKNIKDYAFGENRYLKKIVIPNSVEKISPWNSFIAKDSIIFEDGDTSIEFVWHKNSYRGFFSSRYIYFGRQIKSIQHGALTLELPFWGLAGCNKIETIEYGSSVKKPFPLTYDIGSHNIYGMESLKTIILGENTDDIFSGLDVPSLERIICRSDKPRGFETSKGYFSDSQYLNIKLFIPKGTLEHYLKAEGWKNFFNIEEAETKSVTIQAKDYKRPYGEKNPVFQYSSSDLSLDGIPNISCSANENSNVGKYPIIVTQGTLKNVCVNYVNGTLTIEKAPLKITAKSYTIKQGDALPTFEAEYSGFKNNETASVLSTQPTVRTTATSASEPGTYDIIVSGASATNYDITYVKGTLTITKADEVVVTAKSYSRQYGGANPNLEYTTAGATLSGTPAISCAATVASPVGEYDIVASKGSVTNYNVTYVNGKLTVTKAPLTITAKSYTIKQGDALPTFEAEYSGFKNNETASVLSTQPTVRTTATSASEPGTYDIIVSGASATNYDITYVKGTLTITQADPVTVAAKSYSRQYGETNPNFEYTTAGATLSGTPAISCAATVASPVGEYDIVASKGSVTNYNVTYVNGKLTITKAPLTVTAKSYTIKQGDALPTFEAEYSGFKNNETASVLSTQPTVRTTATSASEPGIYDIIVSGAAANNYDISYVKGTLTITQADPVTVAAKSYNRQYGEANPNFEYTISGTSLSGTPSVSCAATATSPVGEYEIVAGKGSVTNYNVTYVNGKLTVTKAPLTITAKSYTIKQGDALPTFEAEYSGFKNNETASVLSTQPTVRTTATSASEPGIYDIIVSGAAANNYDISYVKGTLKIIAIDVNPVTEKTNIFSESVSGDTDLSNTVIDNTYYTLSSANGDGYDTVEKAIVLNSTTTESQMKSIVNAEIGDAIIRQNYNGIIFEVAAGSGTITIDAKTNGTHVLNVQIGKAKPSQITRSTRGTADVTYSVTVPTYIYLYASTASTNAVQTRAISANSVLLYSYKVTPGTTGIQNVSMDNPVDVYDMRGILVRTKVTTLNGLAKGIYIVNGRKVIVE